MRATQKFIELALWFFLIVIFTLAVALYFINIKTFAGFNSFVVQSGSMEPSIMTGDIIVTKSYSKYLLNDVITFTDLEDRTVTHRIVNIENDFLYNTKGDANRSQDYSLIKQSQIIGKVVLVVPKLGLFVAYSKTFYGLLLLVFLPFAVIVINTLFNLKHAKS